MVVDVLQPTLDQITVDTHISELWSEDIIVKVPCLPPAFIQHRDLNAPLDLVRVLQTKSQNIRAVAKTVSTVKSASSVNRERERSDRRIEVGRSPGRVPVANHATALGRWLACRPINRRVGIGTCKGR